MNLQSSDDEKQGKQLNVKATVKPVERGTKVCKSIKKKASFALES